MRRRRLFAGLAAQLRAIVRVRQPTNLHKRLTGHALHFQLNSIIRQSVTYGAAHALKVS